MSASNFEQSKLLIENNVGNLSGNCQAAVVKLLLIEQPMRLKDFSVLFKLYLQNIICNYTILNKIQLKTSHEFNASILCFNSIIFQDHTQHRILQIRLLHKQMQKKSGRDNSKEVQEVKVQVEK